MKTVILSAVTASVLMLGACAHSPDETAAMTPDQMRAEVAAISQELADINAMSKEDAKRATVQNRASAMALGVSGRAAGSDFYGRQFEGPLAVQPVNSARQLSKQDRLQTRLNQLRAQLAASESEG